MAMLCIMILPMLWIIISFDWTGALVTVQGHLDNFSQVRNLRGVKISCGLLNARATQTQPEVVITTKSTLHASMRHNHLIVYVGLFAIQLKPLSLPCMYRWIPWGNGTYLSAPTNGHTAPSGISLHFLRLSPRQTPTTQFPRPPMSEAWGTMFREFPSAL